MDACNRERQARGVCEWRQRIAELLSRLHASCVEASRAHTSTLEGSGEGAGTSDAGGDERSGA